MKYKTQILSFSIICIFIIQNISIISALDSSSAIKILQNENTIIKERKKTETLKVIIGCPDTIDINDPITVIVAGLRDAKSVYVKPISLKIGLYFIEQSASAIKTEEKEVLLYLKESWDYNNQWISRNESSKIIQLNQYLYKTEFPAINVDAKLRIKVYFRWVTPWNEIYTSTNEKTILTGNWRNYQQYLETSANDVRNNVAVEFSDETKIVDNILNEIRDVISDLNNIEEYNNALKQMGTADPSSFHFYLLNISSIVDFNNPNSFVSQMDNTTIYKNGKTEWKYYFDLLKEINEAFIQSFSILERKNISYIITYVNYTYQDTVYEESIDYLGYNIGAKDCNWDDENINTTSLEFLLEGAHWTGHPDLGVTTYHITFDGSSSINGITPLSSIMQYNGKVQNENLKNLTLYQGTTNNRIKHVNMYPTYVKIYKNESGIITYLTEGTDFIVNGSTSIIFLHPLEEKEYHILIDVPGGRRKENKSIIVNLMGDLFPILNRLYIAPQNLRDPNPNTEYNEYYLPIDSPMYINPPILYCKLNTTEDGYITMDTLLNDIEGEFNANEENYFSLIEYFYYLGGFLSGLPYYINPVMKPFARLIYSNQYYNVGINGDKYNSVLEERDYDNFIKYILLNSTTNETTINFIHSSWQQVSFFQIFDLFVGITTERDGSVAPKPIRTDLWYYKNEIVGKWIEAFFYNGNTTLDAEFVQGHSEGWTFKYIDRSLLPPDAKNIPAQYQLSPFSGPDDYVPIGIMTTGSLMFIQNSLKNLTAGFGYSYGLIFNLYRRTYDITKSQLNDLKTMMFNENNTRAAQKISMDLIELDDAWNTLNLTKLDYYVQLAVDYYNNPYNIYTSNNEVSLREQKLQYTREKVNNAITKLKKYESTANYIDNEISKTEYDVQKLGILDQVITFLNDQVLPWLHQTSNALSSSLINISNSFSNFTSTTSEFFKREISAFNKTWNDFNNNIISKLNQTGKGIGNYFSQIGSNLDTTISVISGIVIGIGTAFLSYLILRIIDVNIVVATGAAVLAGIIAGFLAAGATSLRNIYGTNTFSTFFKNLGITIEDTFSTVAQHLKNGLDTVRSSTITALNGVCNVFKNIGNTLSSTVASIANSINLINTKLLEVAKLTILSTIKVIQMINSVLDKVIDVIGKIFTTVFNIFDNIKNTIVNIGKHLISIMGESFGKIKILITNTFGGIFNSLSETYNRLKNHAAFIKVSHLAEKLKNALDRSAVLRYQTEYGNELTEEMILSYADVVRPLYNIASADYGYYLVQIGDEFCDELYYAFFYNGSLISPDIIDFKVRRFANLSEYQGQGNAILESRPLIRPLQVNNKTVEGIYTISFKEGETITWYKENSTDPFVTAAAPSGNYLTIMNGTLLNVKINNTNQNISITNVIRTKLFTQEYITDAFPIISLATEGNVEIGEPAFVFNAGGTPTILEIGIHNKMWSNVTVNIDLALIQKTSSTLDSNGGTTISQLRYINIPLSPEQEVFVAASFSVGKYVASGDYYLLINVIETNGDITSVYYNVKVIQSDIFISFILLFFNSWYGYAAIIVVITIIVSGFILYQKKKMNLIHYQTFRI